MVSMKWIHSVFIHIWLCKEILWRGDTLDKKTYQVLCNTDMRRWSLDIKIKYVKYAAGTV